MLDASAETLVSIIHSLLLSYPHINLIDPLVAPSEKSFRPIRLRMANPLY